MDGRTDRIPIANTRSQQYLPVQLSRVKTITVKNTKFSQTLGRQRAAVAGKIIYDYMST